ncbi:hypothetical protein [Nostoc sp. 106C]|nr:hypothetical protein [Nostoc sp. 106C]
MFIIPSAFPDGVVEDIATVIAELNSKNRRSHYCFTHSTKTAIAKQV